MPRGTARGERAAHIVEQLISADDELLKGLGSGGEEVADEHRLVSVDDGEVEDVGVVSAQVGKPHVLYGTGRSACRSRCSL